MQNLIQIKNTNGDIICEHTCNYNSIKKTVEHAVYSNISLKEASLNRVNLSGANLHGANLHGADLYRTDLSDADLSNTNLYGAYLSRADLSDADLSNSNLYGVSLFNANLANACLSGVNLFGADLSGADLSGANLSKTNLSYIITVNTNLSDANLKNIKLNKDFINNAKKDFMFVSRIFKNELPSLRENLVKGSIDGRFYNKECCCLIGNISKSSNKSFSEIENKLGRLVGTNNPSEEWFLYIRPGHTPENNFFSEKALKWLDEVLSE